MLFLLCPFVILPVRPSKCIKPANTSLRHPALCVLHNLILRTTQKYFYLSIRIPPPNPAYCVPSSCGLVILFWPFSVFGSRERLCPKENGILLPNGRLLEMEPLTELPSNDDLTSNNGVENWLETSSKYHSCEVVDN